MIIIIKIIEIIIIIIEIIIIIIIVIKIIITIKRKKIREQTSWGSGIWGLGLLRSLP